PRPLLPSSLSHWRRARDVTPQQGAPRAGSRHAGGGGGGSGGGAAAAGARRCRAGPSPLPRSRPPAKRPPSTCWGWCAATGGWSCTWSRCGTPPRPCAACSGRCGAGRGLPVPAGAARPSPRLVIPPCRWQRPLCSLLACLGINLLLLTLDRAAWYSVLAVLVLLPAVLGYLQETCRARPAQRELARSRRHSVRREELRSVRLSRQEALSQVKGFLIQLEGFLSALCCSCEAAHRVLYWENPAVSSQFYGALLGSVCMLYLLPLCWVMAILNSTLFLGNPQFYQVMKELKASIEQCLGTKPLQSAPEPAEPLPAAAPPDRTPTPTSTEDLTPGSVEEAEEAEPDEEFKDAIEEDDEGSQCSADFDLSLPDNGFMSKNDVIRSKVSRLTERLRKRYPSNNFGSCTGCGATFSVLKKRGALVPWAAAPGSPARAAVRGACSVPWFSCCCLSTSQHSSSLLQMGTDGSLPA
uniref:Zinc finger FYVE-type containing 27 n=1 Tax=Anas platyrhynchos platyrhynchos TaxID=8840 RepID=A0A493T1B8_ANAPP